MWSVGKSSVEMVSIPTPKGQVCCLTSALLSNNLVAAGDAARALALMMQHHSPSAETVYGEAGSVAALVELCGQMENLSVAGNAARALTLMMRHHSASVQYEMQFLQNPKLKSKWVLVSSKSSHDDKQNADFCEYSAGSDTPVMDLQRWCPSCNGA